MRCPYGELEHWLGKFYGDFVQNSGGLYPLGTDEDIMQALDLMAYGNRQQLATKQYAKERKQNTALDSAVQAIGEDGNPQTA